MKISESVVTILITILGILPFIWFTYIGRKNFGKSKKAIKEITKSEGLTLNEKEAWNYNFIGIDNSKGRLLFIKVKSTGNEVVNIDLNTIKTCQIDRSTRDYKRENKTETELQKLNLELMFHTKESNIVLNFYDINEQLSEDLELKRAEKWQALILQIANKNVIKNDNKKAA